MLVVSAPAFPWGTPPDVDDTLSALNSLALGPAHTKTRV